MTRKISAYVQYRWKLFSNLFNPQWFVECTDASPRPAED
jgi:hypothetical protein